MMSGRLPNIMHERVIWVSCGGRGTHARIANLRYKVNAVMQAWTNRTRCGLTFRYASLALN